jgi:hypothetical protein
MGDSIFEREDGCIQTGNHDLHHGNPARFVPSLGTLETVAGGVSGRKQEGL